MSFLGAIGTTVLDFWWHIFWVSKPEWVLPYWPFYRGKCNEHSLRSTSGATHANLFVSGIAASHFSTCISRGGTWLRFKWAITHSGFFLIHIVEAIVMYIPWDLPLVLHIANRLTVDIVRWQFKMMAQYCHLAVHYPSHMRRSALYYYCIMLACFTLLKPQVTCHGGK